MNPAKSITTAKNGELKDLTNAVFDEHEVEIEGVKVFIRAHNPHGLYRLSLAHGRLPEKLTGSYTSKSGAEADARRYFANKGREIAA